MRVLVMCLLAVLCCQKSWAADHLVLITLDGLRWQELFRGYEDALLESEDFTKRPEDLKVMFDGESTEQKREKLMPFMWQTVAKQGVLIGNQDKQSSMLLTNTWWFSYPGYNEILTGKADPSINSNEAVPNKNVTILEWVNQHKDNKSKVAAFTGWDAFPAIINEQRSGVMVNAAFENAQWNKLSDRAKVINELQHSTPSPWHNVRFDAFTYGLAKEYLLAEQPKLMYIALGETDDFAHQEEYDQYIKSAHRSDQFIADLWQTIQTTKGLKGNTNIVIAVDHGRGVTAQTWPHHASAKALKQYFKMEQQPKEGIVGSNAVWLAAIGPDIRALGELTAAQPMYQNQIAATVLSLLGYQFTDYATDIGKPLTTIIEP
ncbi:alkaline phosphatase family protein [Halioxenophilus aromaticivorans]|uniref:Phosphoglyceromutase n=1 Tax=Halioxenophilus aromaticivorans TaxID=1306992 RepID=A0AAV3TX50_9ALTE